MSLRMYGTISGWGRSAGAVIPALGSGRYAPGPNIGLPSWLQGADPHCTLNVFWGQPGALATVSSGVSFSHLSKHRLINALAAEINETDILVKTHRRAYR